MPADRRPGAGLVDVGDSDEVVAGGVATAEVDFDTEHAVRRVGGSSLGPVGRQVRARPWEDR